MNELEGLIPLKERRVFIEILLPMLSSKPSVDEYDKYMASYNKRQKEEAEKNALQKEVSDLKSEMGDIKSLLLTLVQNQSKHYDD